MIKKFFYNCILLFSILALITFIISFFISDIEALSEVSLVNTKAFSNTFEMLKFSILVSVGFTILLTPFIVINQFRKEKQC